MIDLLFVWVGFVICFANAFCDDLRVAFSVTSVLTVCTLHTSGILEKFSAKSAAHNVIELLLDKLVALLFMDFFLLLADGALSIQAYIEWPSTSSLFLEAHGQMDSASWFERKPGVDHDLWCLLRDAGRRTGTCTIAWWHEC